MALDLLAMPRDLLRGLAVSTFTIDTSAKGFAWAVNPPTTKNLVAVIVPFSTVTGTPSLDVRIEGFDTSTGKANGTLAWANANKTVALSSADSNTWKRIVLTASGSFTGGANNPLFVLLVPPSSGTNPDASNNYIVQRGMTASDSSNGIESNQTASSGLTTTGGRSNFAITSTYSNSVVLEFDDGTYYAGNAYGAIESDLTLQIFGANRSGLQFSLKEPAYLYEVYAFMFRTGTPAQMVLDIIDANNNVISSCSGYNRAATPTAATAPICFRFDSAPPLLKANTTYRAVLYGGTVDTSSNRFNLNYIDTYNNALLPNGGLFQYVASTDTGSTWTPTATRLPLMQLILAPAPNRRLAP